MGGPLEAKAGQPLDAVRYLAEAFANRANALGLTPNTKKRDEVCLDFMTGAAALACHEHGEKSGLAVVLLKVCMFVISLRGEKGLTDFCGK